MAKPSLLLFPTLLVVGLFFALSGAQELPDTVAVHFDASGSADGWASRNTYQILILLLLTGLPLLLVWLMAGLPRLTNGRGQIPDNDYWFEKARRRETEAFLLAHACWLGSMTVAVVYGIHVSILRANALTPPTLATSRLLTIIGIYLIGLVWWTSSFLRRFHKT
jgi:uncharacterized membrane protein